MLGYFSDIFRSYSKIGVSLIDNNTIAILALLGGILPALLWLWFWLKEDTRKPEPKIRIALTFVMGMFIGFIVLPIEHFADLLAPPIKNLFHSPFIVSLILFGLYAFIEELFKYLAAFVTALRTKVAEEPVDSIIYLITAALGFSAFENTLYLLVPLFEGSWLSSVVLVNFRFIGASLLHVASSAIIGIFIAFSFYKNHFQKRFSLLIGLILATGLHAVFNLLIIKGETTATLSMLGLVWIVVIIVLLFFEKVKRLSKKL